MFIIHSWTFHEQILCQFLLLHNLQFPSMILILLPDETIYCECPGLELPLQEIVDASA